MFSKINLSHDETFISLLSCFTDLNQIQHTVAYHLKKIFFMLLDESSPASLLQAVMHTGMLQLNSANK